MTSRRRIASPILWIALALAGAGGACSPTGRGDVKAPSAHARSPLRLVLEVTPRELRDVDEEVAIIMTITNRSNGDVWLPAQEVSLNHNLLVATSREPARARRELEHMLANDLRPPPPFQLGDDGKLAARSLAPGESLSFRADGLPLVAYGTESAAAPETGDWHVIAAVQIKCGVGPGARPAMLELFSEPITVSVRERRS